MSTLPNLILEFCDRIARERGPKEWDRLRVEITGSPLKACQQLCLLNLIAKRFQQEREEGKVEILKSEIRNGVAA